MKRIWLSSVSYALILNLFLFAWLPYLARSNNLVIVKRYAVDLVSLPSAKPKTTPGIMPEPKRELRVKPVVKKEEALLPHPEPLQPTAQSIAGEEVIAEETGEETGEEAFVADIKELDEPLRIIESKRIEYPEVAYRQGLEGLLVLKILIDPGGRPVEIEIIQDQLADFPCFRKSAKEAVSQWRFSKPTVSGLAVSCWYILPVRFK